MSKKTTWQVWEIPFIGSYVLHIDKEKGYTKNDWKEIEQLVWNEYVGHVQLDDIVDSDGAELIEEQEED